MSYKIEEMNENNILDYVKVNALAWKQSYKGIVDSGFLEFINTEERIKRNVDNLKSGESKRKRFLLKVDDKYVGVLGIGKSKYLNYEDYGEINSLYLLDGYKKYGYGKVLFQKAIDELKDKGYHYILVGCLEDNPSNDFYQHMGGQFIEYSLLTLFNGQKLKEKVYKFKI